MTDSVRHSLRPVKVRYRAHRDTRSRRRWYERNRRRHLEACRPDVAAAPDPEVMRAIVADGVAVVRGFLPPDVIEQIAVEVRPSVEAVAEGRYDGPLPALAVAGEGVARLRGVEDSLSPTSRRFFESEFIAGLADAMTVSGMHSKDRYVDFKHGIGGRDPNDDFHIDHWKLRFKAFLPLGDVSEANAPFVYVTGSHLGNHRWRRSVDRDYQEREAEGAVMTRDRVARLCGRYGYEERTFTTNAGDLVVAVTRGLHRGTPLQQGNRLQLVNLFAMNGPPEYAC